MHIRTRRALVALGAGGLIMAFSTTGSTALADQGIETSAPISAATSDAARPEVPSSYAQAVFDSWVAGDGASLVDLAAPEVVQLLAARSAEGDMWARSPRVCQAATGSTYCTRYSGDVQLTLRVANQAASVGAAHAATSAAFTGRPGAVAIWPMTTTEEAWKTQAKVDAGRSQWMLDPKAVVSAYASAELGFTEPVVESTAPTYFSLRVVDATTGVAADIEVNQPARAALGGIWAIARVNSLPAEGAVIPQ
jgi:hypothetical protein